MIPENITPDNVLKAIERIRSEGYPAQRASTGFDLLFEGERHPPKVVISYANALANGADLPETEFSGGAESNEFLRKLGFEIVPKEARDSVRARILLVPDSFDIANLSVGATIPWAALQLGDPVRVGDRVFFWRATEKGDAECGVIASGRINHLPLDISGEATAQENSTRRGPKRGVRVWLEVDRVASTRQIVKRDWLVDDPVLSGLEVLTGSTDATHLLRVDETKRLEDLWNNTGRTWSRAESLAGLWTYAQTRGDHISRGHDSVVADVALRIGRAVSGVYNKVMNFRALDPRDERAGLPAVSGTDEKVWDEFFDPTTRSLRTAQLAAEYEKLWLDLERAERTATSPRGISGTTRSGIVDPREEQGGQGYLLDKWKRRAIEQHAMKIAQDHYEAAGYSVRDTSTMKPYDLLCIRGDTVVRVEVKGSMGKGERIIVTIGEVNNARGDGWRTDLFIVHGIVVDGDGPDVAARGGAIRTVECWNPSYDNLSALTFEYRVPSG